MVLHPRVSAAWSTGAERASQSGLFRRVSAQVLMKHDDGVGAGEAIGEPLARNDRQEHLGRYQRRKRDRRRRCKVFRQRRIWKPSSMTMTCAPACAAASAPAKRSRETRAAPSRAAMALIADFDGFHVRRDARWADGAPP